MAVIINGNGTVTGVTSADGLISAGTIAFFGASSAPTGYLKANGAAVSRTTYATLFATIGTTFGTGDGSTTFNVPDLRGYFPRGWADNGSTDSGRVFGSTQADDFKSHSHVMPNQGYGLNGTAGSSMWTVINTAANTNATGGTETRPVNLALLACIKY